jgi:hypothetical protein
LGTQHREKAGFRAGRHKPQSQRPRHRSGHHAVGRSGSKKRGNTSERSDHPGKAENNHGKVNQFRKQGAKGNIKRQPNGKKNIPDNGKKRAYPGSGNTKAESVYPKGYQEKETQKAGTVETD